MQICTKKVGGRGSPARVQTKHARDIDARPKVGLTSPRASFVPVIGSKGKAARINLPIEFNANLPRRGTVDVALVKVDAGINTPNIDRSFEFDELIFTLRRVAMVLEVIALANASVF